ncbi:MAG: hypothetical protein IJ121_00425 [Eubacterium sp.]|nr:hypothetical protein [Eubacterium sp.]
MISKSKDNQTFQLTGRALKWIACICMLADHFAKCFSLNGVSYFLLSDLIGRITFPVFCMLLAEGFFHTRRRSRYILRVLLLALLSEIPFDLAIFHNICDWSAQNTCFTLVLGLLMFSVLEWIRSNPDRDYRLGSLLQIAAILLFATASCLLHTDYQANGIAALAVFYYGFTGLSQETENRPLSPKRGITAAAACLCLNIYQFYNAGAFLSVLPLSLYNGQRGKISRFGKYAFYLFYPLHLLVLVLLHII